MLPDSSNPTLSWAAVSHAMAGGASLPPLPNPHHVRPAKLCNGKGARLMSDPAAYSQPTMAFPLGESLEPKLKECILRGLYVPMNIILLSEEGINVDFHLRTLSVASCGDACSCPYLPPLTIDRWMGFWSLLQFG